ncbi:uncharacterized protein LOC129607555 [Condylostylus longicornis]|uniref:uncharacterized protein LOC129607555 n=1 Tax=Condylostylus longicornis TaxID=2530218 RepID=UPI00244DD7E7|nr:uncharacterized protein LOC129607555 [Condylostylus longicornis]
MISLTLIDVPVFLAPVIAVVIPSVFVFLWGLISGDFKNFKGSKRAYTEFTATDAVNCYSNYKKSS